MTIALNSTSQQDNVHVPYTKPTPANASSYQPTHPRLLRVILQQGQGADGQDSYSSFLIAEQVGHSDRVSSRRLLKRCVFFTIKDLPANTVVTKLTNLTTGTKAYSSVQHGSGEHDHFELNSDLLFVNHSCSPNVAFDLSTPRSAHDVEQERYPAEWNLRTLSRPVAKGEVLTFFYPSTEWDMGAPFKCNCGESNCLGTIRGAKHLSLAQLKQQEFINPHIMQMKLEEAS
ncbi:hypothetical protein QFC19_001205 [Naganishia cerealis]|uniref:Uncharacterized protein n=1 Tax=Naganishia cerealis TaxID=610337 RepID=A0ACC2WK16_9TREE|nr:hypothetical protein QFC19_001205 [Naganishia cerealis]